MAYSLSPRENYFLAYNHKPYEYLPSTLVDVGRVGGLLPIERGAGGSGTDAFGVRWVSPPTGGLGSAIPTPGEFMLKDVTEWKKVIKFPDVSSYDWAGYAATEEANLNREMQFIEAACSNHIFERLACFMGFEAP